MEKSKHNKVMDNYGSHYRKFQFAPAVALSTHVTRITELANTGTDAELDVVCKGKEDNVMIIDEVKKRPRQCSYIGPNLVELKEVVFGAWSQDRIVDVLDKIAACSAALSDWHKSQDHNFKYQIALLKKRIDVARQANVNDVIIVRLKIELSTLLPQEAIYWKQRSKIFWLKYGEANSRFFHSQASRRKRLPYPL
ncbi:hypothetical protein K2173_005881 [Erythroxylum novogranatense]|uniref:Uncharacterized protein n=1 Tax=Erythroxylum novogranatense TaxID=1862640 RepID=A0AAV8U330_9ROSI|nr:hypothetical protein K2173_005881 [Erythroxylum novogranatense]